MVIILEVPEVQELINRIARHRYPDAELEYADYYLLYDKASALLEHVAEDRAGADEIFEDEFLTDFAERVIDHIAYLIGYQDLSFFQILNYGGAIAVTI